MDKKNEPIKDKEFELYLRSTYRHKLEEEILKTGYGKRIKELEKLGIGMSLEDAIDKYVERSGYTLDNLGNVKLEEDSIGGIYKENVTEASKKIGFDISGLDAKQISQVINQLEYVQDVKDIRIDGKTIEGRKVQDNQMTNNLIEICKKLNIQEAEYSLDKNDMKMLLRNLKFSEEEINQYIATYEKNSLETFLSTTSDKELIKNLAIFSYVFETKQYSNLDTEITELQRFLNEDCLDSKFLKYIVDENGKFDLERGLKFFKDFKEKREESDLTRQINKYSTKKELNKSDEEKLAEIFVVAYSKGNDIQKQNMIAIAQTNGIDIIDENGKIDRSKVEEYGKKIHGKDFNFSEILEEYSFEGQAACDKLDRIGKSILNGHTTETPTSVEDVNNVRKTALRNEKRICSAKEKIIYDVLNSQNALTPLVDYYKNPENAKQLILLFCKFRDEEIIANNPNRKGPFNSKSVNSGKNENSVSWIIGKYIKEHKEVFGEYLRSDGKLNQEKVMEIVNANELNASRAANSLIAYEQIKKRTDEIDALENDKANKSKLNDIEKFLKKNEEQDLTEEEKNELYSLAKHIPVDILSTQNLEALKKLDEAKFKEAFKGKKVERNVGKDSLGAIYFSAAKLLVKGVYALPKMLINKEARKEYMPKIKKHIESGTKRIMNLNQNNQNGEHDGEHDSTTAKPKKGIFSNIFKKNTPKQLEAGVSATPEKLDRTLPENSDKISANQQTFEEHYKVNNSNGQVEKKAAEDAAKNTTENRDVVVEEDRSEDTK